MKKVGIAGMGFMGWIHWLAYQQVPGMQVTSICSRDPRKRTGDWSGIQGNFGPAGRQVDLTGIRCCADLTDLLQDSSLDLIDICLPPGLHAAAATSALQAGKHVLCEKPMALTTAQCDQMLAAADRHQRNLLVGHVLPFFPEYALVADLARQQTYGALLGGEFKRTVADPTWIDGFYDPQVAGGPLIDLHVHDAHFIRALFGMPRAVTSKGRWRGQCIEYCATLFDFDRSDLVVSSHGGVIQQQGRPFTHAFEVRFEKATAQFEFGAFADQTESMPLKILTMDGQVIRPTLADGDPVQAFVGELGEVWEVLENGRTSSLLDGRLARDAIAICHAQTQSVRTGQSINLPAASCDA